MIMSSLVNKEFRTLAREYLPADKKEIDSMATALSVDPQIIYAMRRGMPPSKDFLLQIVGGLSLSADQTKKWLAASGYVPLSDMEIRLKKKYEDLRIYYTQKLAEVRDNPASWAKNAAAQYQTSIKDTECKLQLIAHMQDIRSSTEPLFYALSTELSNDPVYSTGSSEVKRKIKNRQLTGSEYLEILVSEKVSKNIHVSELREMVKELFYSPTNGYPTDEGTNILLCHLSPNLRALLTHNSVNGENPERVMTRRIEPLVPTPESSMHELPKDTPQNNIKQRIINALTIKPMSVAELSKSLDMRREYLGGFLEALYKSGELVMDQIGRAKVYKPKSVAASSKVAHPETDTHKPDTSTPYRKLEVVEEGKKVKIVCLCGKEVSGATPLHAEANLEIHIKTSNFHKAVLHGIEERGRHSQLGE